MAMGCGGTVGAPEPVASSEESIIGGTPSNAAAANGWVLVNHPGYGWCTGTLLQNDLVITAKHCVTFDGTINGPVDLTGSDYVLTMGAAISSPASEIITDPNDDVAIIQMSKFMPMNGTLYNWSRQIYSGSDASLQNQTVNCYGYGSTNASPCAGTPPNRGVSIRRSRPRTSK
jgi:hypothetical protein